MVTEQLSVATGGLHDATPLQDALAETLIVDGHNVRTGGILSTTVTLNEQSVLLPVPSVAV
jgi:hypothetical protein